MTCEITEFESTPNPNAVKCHLSRPVSDGPRSYLSPEAAADNPLVSAIFRQTGATAVLILGDWMTINKPPERSWSSIKRTLKKIMADT